MNYNDDAGQFSGGEDDDYGDEDCEYSGDEGIAGIDTAPVAPVNDYQVLAQDSLNDVMNKISHETSAVLGFPPQVCKILLHKYHWNKESLLER